jgi:hypothetical protein
MNNSQSLRRLILITTLLILSSVIAVGVYTRSSKFQKNQKDHPHTYEAAKVTAAPEVRSTIKDLEISGFRLINEGTPEAAVVIDVTNQRDEDVMALDFVAGKGKSTSSGLAMDGLLEEDRPLVIVPRHSLKTFTWNLGSILDGETIFLTVAVFSDGKEEGDKHFLDALKKSRIKYQESRRAEKIKNGGQK